MEIDFDDFIVYDCQFIDEALVEEGGAEFLPCDFSGVAYVVGEFVEEVGCYGAEEEVVERQDALEGGFGWLWGTWETLGA
jgi:hypothetical protein